LINLMKESDKRMSTKNFFSFQHSNHKFKSVLLKSIVTIILISFLLFKVKPDRIIEVFSEINIALVLAALPFIALLYVIRALKWNVLLKSINIKCGIWKSVKIILIGTFYGMVTPGKTGELARAYYLKEKTSKIIPTVIWDKMIDVASLVVLSAIAILILFKNYALFFITMAIGIALIIGIFLITNKKIMKFISRLLKISPESYENYFSSMITIAKSKGAIIKAFMLGLLFYFISFFPAFLILTAFKASINPLLVFSLPLIILLGNAPITISGLGLREGVTVLIFQLMNESTSIGFSFSLLWFFIMTVSAGIIGYLFTITYDHEKHKISRKDNITNVIKVVFGIIILLFIFFKIGIQKIIDTIILMNLWYLIPVFITYAVIFYLGAVNIWLLTSKLNKKISFQNIFKYSLLGWAFSNFLPGKIGDFSLIYFLKKEGMELGETTAIVIINRILTVFTLFVIAIIGFFFFFDLKTTIYLILIIIVILFVFIFLFISKSGRSFIKKIVLRKLADKFHGFFTTIRFFLKKEKKIMALNCGITLMKWIISGVLFYFYFLSFQVSAISVFYIIIITATVIIVSLIPISAGGLGFREGAAVYLYDKIFQEK